MRAPSEGITWRKIDPWVKAVDFLGKDITRGVQISGVPTILLPNKNTAEVDAPSVGGKVSYEVSYTIIDLRGLSTVIFRQVDVIATRPKIDTATIPANLSVPMSDPDGKIFQGLINEIEIYDVKGDRLTFQRDSDQSKSETGYFYLDPEPDFSPRADTADDTRFEFQLIAVDWRGLKALNKSYLRLMLLRQKSK